MMFEDITREYGSDVGPLRRHSAEKQNDSKRNSLRKRSMPIVTHNNEQDLEAVEVEKTNFSVVIAPKVKTIKIKVIPDDILLWLTIPLNCSASISEIEQKIRQELRFLHFLLFHVIPLTKFKVIVILAFLTIIKCILFI